MVIRGGKPMAAVYLFNTLSATGTAILFVGLFSIPVMGASVSQALEVARDTLKKLRLPILTISAVLGFAFIFNYSGMVITLGTAFAMTGALFPFFSAFVGWLGVFMTGSDTSSNALFGKLQYVTATKIGVDPIVTVAANSSGGVCGKMISPQSLAVATAAVGLVGHESDIFRFTLKHSIILTAVVGVMACLQAYVIKWIVPVAAKVAAAAPPVAAAAAAAVAKPAFPSDGLLYLAITGGLALVVTVLSRVMGNPARA